MKPYWIKNRGLCAWLSGWVLLWLLVALWGIPVSGWAQLPPPQASSPLGASWATLELEGRTYRYLVHQPPETARQPMPVLLAFHGLRMSAPSMMTYTDLNRTADQQGWMVIYPNAPLAGWRVDSVPEDADGQDARFVSALLDRLQALPQVDSRRIYAVGFSNGGFFTQRLACDLSDRIAAFASVASTMGIPLQAHCAAKRPVPVLMINNARDYVVSARGVGRGRGLPVIGTTRVVPLKETAAFWVGRNGCQPVAVVTRTGPVGKRPTVERTRYPGCPQGGEVVQWLTLDGGHVWPGAEPMAMQGNRFRNWVVRRLIGKQTQALSTNEVIAEFFRDKSLPNP